jgi:hypothetical protein
VTFPTLSIDGASIFQALTAQGFTWAGNGLGDTYVAVTGLPAFTTATFSDASSPAFEFALGSALPTTREVPGPEVGGGVPGVLLAGALVWFARRRAGAQT